MILMLKLKSLTYEGDGKVAHQLLVCKNMEKIQFVIFEYYS